MITTIAGTGISGSNGDSGPANSAQLSSPRGISVAPSKDLYIADYGNNFIRKVSASTNLITTFSGGAGGGLNPLQSPSGVSISSDGNTVYIADSSNAVVR